MKSEWKIYFFDLGSSALPADILIRMMQKMTCHEVEVDRRQAVTELSCATIYLQR